MIKHDRSETVWQGGGRREGEGGKGTGGERKKEDGDEKGEPSGGGAGVQWLCFHVSVYL